jgi:hypothetical protein
MANTFAPQTEHDEDLAGVSGEAAIFAFAFLLVKNKLFGLI